MARKMFSVQTSAMFRKWLGETCYVQKMTFVEAFVTGSLFVFVAQKIPSHKKSNPTNYDRDTPA